MKYKGIIFDLDGTLVNSISDIVNAMNAVLTERNFPIHGIEAYFYFVGSGLRNTVKEALPDHHKTEMDIENCLIAFMEIYNESCAETTKPYSGIVELLIELKTRNIKTCVLSNKADNLTKKVVQAVLPEYFEIVIGLTTEELKKPSPSVALSICKELEINPEEFIFVGDSGIDMQTANNANMVAVGVKWGFRPEEELITNGAKFLLEHPLDLLTILDC